jgi:hypothetical protein
MVTPVTEADQSQVQGGPAVTASVVVSSRVLKIKNWLQPCGSGYCPCDSCRHKRLTLAYIIELESEVRQLRKVKAASLTEESCCRPSREET